MPEKELFLNFRAREFQTTQKVLRAYPADQLELKPAEISRSARELILVFIREEFINKGLAGNRMGEPDLSPEALGNLPEMVAMYENVFNRTTEELMNLTDADLDRQVEFFGRPARLGDALWLELFDMIHHRGQLSVYIRIAGGKVPAIYGSSADEPIS